VTYWACPKRILIITLMGAVLVVSAAIADRKLIETGRCARHGPNFRGDSKLNELGLGIP
jgi:hypothetical protein